MKNKNYGCGIFIDFRKAFDSTITLLFRNWNIMFPMSYHFIYLLMTLIYSLKQATLIFYKPLLIRKSAKL